MPDGNWHDGNGWWFLMVIMMIAFWGGLTWIGISLSGTTHQAAQLSRPNAEHTCQRASAQEILAERLARGEIDTDDYRHRLDALREPPTS